MSFAVRISRMRVEWRQGVFLDEIERHLHEDDILNRLEIENLSTHWHKHTNTIKEINKINFRFDIIMGRTEQGMGGSALKMFLGKLESYIYRMYTYTTSQNQKKQKTRALRMNSFYFLLYFLT